MPEGSRRFTRRTEDFVCARCGHEVTGTGYTNHCPQCLWSRHVDVLPGDRQATCLGMMRPVGVLFEQGEFVLAQQCVECGHVWRNRCAPGDNRDALLALTGRAVAEPAAGQRQGRPG
jgi:RNHCP domain